MGKKKVAQKPTAEKPPAPTAREEPPVQTPPPTSTPAGRLISTDAVLAFLKAANPNADAQALLAALNQIAGVPAATTSQPVPAATPSPPVPSADNAAKMPDTVPTTTLDPPSKSPPQTETPFSTDPAPQIDPTEVLDPTPISAYRLPADREEGEEGYKGEGTDEEDYTTEDTVEVTKEDTVEGDKMKRGEEQEDLNETFEGEAAMEMDADKTTTEEPDLDEIAKKQGLMTDEEFENMMQGAPQEEDRTAEMAEGLDLASQAEGGENPEEKTQHPGSAPSESVQKEGRTEEKQSETPKESSIQEDEGRQKQEKEPSRSVKQRLIVEEELVDEQPKVQHFSLRRSRRTAPTDQADRRSKSEGPIDTVNISDEEDASKEETPLVPDQKEQSQSQTSMQ